MRLLRPLAVVALVLVASGLAAQDLLKGLAERQDYRSRRVSSYDRSGGNRDSIVSEPGAPAVLADIPGPGAVHHIWTTIAAEPFYGRKIVLRVYWDGEAAPSVEAPVGDFFGVGHGLNRNFASLPIIDSSEGRARNCYWYMPFRRSCRITATNDGTADVTTLVISDVLPGFTTLDDGSRDSAGGACGTGPADAPPAVSAGSITGAPACGATGTVQASVGTLAPAASATMTSLDMGRW